MLGNKAITQVQAVLIGAILIIAIIAAGVYYYWPTPTPPNGNGNGPPPSDIKNPDTLIIESFEEVKNLDPHSLTTKSEPMVVQNVFDTLFTTRGEGVGLAGQVLPNLVETYDVSPDGKTYTFHLREDATFSNGDALDADAVKYNLDRMTVTWHPWQMYMFDGILTPYESNCEVVDQYTVQVTTVVVCPYFTSLFTLWHGIVNPSVVEANGGYAADYFNEEIAFTQPLEGLYSGPYKITEFVSGLGGYVKLEINEEYWGPAPQTENVIVQWTPEASARALALKKGDVDMLWEFPTVLLPDLMGAEGVSVDNLGTSWVVGFTIYSGIDPLGMDENGKLVRQALSYAFPYADIINFAYSGYAERAGSTIPKLCPGYYPAQIEKYTFNLNKAAELLDQAGYTNTTGTRMELNAVYQLGEERDKQTFLIWQSALAEIDVKLSIREVTPMLVTELMRTGQADISIYHWYPDYPDPQNFASAMYHSVVSEAIFGSKWGIPELDTLVEDVILEEDHDQRMALYIPIQEMEAENPGKFFIAYPSYVYVHRTWLKGYYYNPFIHIDFSSMYKAD